MNDNKVSLNTFPSNRCEALALLYVQSKNLSEATPEDLAEMYSDAYDRICEKLKEISKEKRDERSQSRSLSMF